MANFPLRSIPGLTWPQVPMGDACKPWSMYLSLDRSQWYSPSEIVEGQLAQVRLLLAHCQQHVPYYQELLRQAGVRPADIVTMADFRRVPILKRQTYQEQFPRFQASRLPDGITKIDEDDTSGTSGVIIPVWHTNRASQWWYALCLRDWAWANIDPRGIMASIRIFHSIHASAPAIEEVSPCWDPILRPLLNTGPLHRMDIFEDPQRQIEWLCRVQPDYLLTHASNAELLASLLHDSGKRIPNLKVVQTMSETLSLDSQRRIEETLGVSVHNFYSCTEAGYVASPCPSGAGMHVHAENVIVEILDENDQPCKPGETGRVVLTPLHNFLTPMVRYDIMDRATLGAPCACGRGLPLLSAVEGKLRPYFRFADGVPRASTVLIARLGALNLCHQYQIVQHAVDHLTVRLIPNSRWEDGSRQTVMECVHAFAQSPINVDVELLSRIPLTAGGKLSSVVIES